MFNIICVQQIWLSSAAAKAAKQRANIKPYIQIQFYKVFPTITKEFTHR